MLLLAVQNLVLDVGQVVILHILLKDLADVRELELIHKLHPVGASDAVSLALRVGLVAEDSSLVEGAVEGSYNGTLGVSNHILLLLVDLVSNITLTSLDEDNLVDLVQLLEENGAGILLSWLKVLEKFEHEESVLLIIPVVVVMVSWVFESLLVVLWDPEESLEDLAEVTEEEVSVNLINDLHGELVEHLFLGIIIDCLVFVIDPLVIEMALNLLLERDLEWHVLVETSNQSEESGEFISLIKV